MALVPQNQFQIVDTDDLRSNLSHLLAKLQNCVINFEIVGNTVIENLKEKQELIKIFHTNTNYIRTATTAGGFISTAVGTAGILMAPATMGATLPLAVEAGFLACAAAGAVEYEYNEKIKKFCNEIELILKELEDPGKSLNDIVEEIEIAIPQMARSVYTQFEADKDQDISSILLGSTVGLGVAFAVVNIGLFIYSWSKKLKIEETIEKLIVMIREEINKWKSYLKELQLVCLASNSYILWQKLQYVIQQSSQRERKQMEEFQKSTQQMKKEFEEHKRQMKLEADERERRIIQDAEERERQMKDELNAVKSQLHERGSQIEEIYKMLQDSANNKK